MGTSITFRFGNFYMATSTHNLAKNIHGTNPQYLIEKVLLVKIWESRYWKEKLFALNSVQLIDVAIELKYIGGSYGGDRRPTNFLCCVCKLLQLQPEKDVVLEFIAQDDYKYFRILGAFYLRLTGSVIDIYNYLEPLIMDWRKIRLRQENGKYTITHVDEIIDKLLTSNNYLNVQLPRIPTRSILEKQG